jgi:hypothetical protein
MRNTDRSFASCASLVAFTALVAISCNSAHLPGTTETGNPPVIDLGKIAIVVSDDEVSIVGKPGAVTPGGAEVTLQVVGSDEVITDKSAPDGSFNQKLDAGADAVIEVRANEADQESETIYVTQGGASVGTGDGGQLSSQQRDQLASQVIINAVDTADQSCQTAADCQKIVTSNMCRDTCEGFYTGKNAIAPIQAAVQAVDKTFCAGFDAHGCSRTIPPCVPPATGPVACVDGVCTQEQSAAIPDCPPNGRYVTDVCDACGIAGGCMTAARCAIVCSDSSACAAPGTGCSARGICEVVGCR